MNASMNTVQFNPQDDDLTHIYAQRDGDEFMVGFLDAEGQIFQLQGRSGVSVGYVSDNNAIMRQMAHDVRELGVYTENGRVTSHGLFEGGDIGWVDDNGTVVRAGLIFGEEEVGRVSGPHLVAAGAALLLLFLPEADEERRSQTQGM